VTPQHLAVAGAYLNGGHTLGKLGIPHGPVENHGQIAGRGLLTGPGQAIGALADGIFRTKGFGFFGHQSGKGLLGTGKLFRQSHAGIICRSKQHGVNQIGGPIKNAFSQINLRSRHVCGISAGFNHLPAIKFFNGDKTGKNFNGAGRLTGPVGITVVQNLAGFGIHDIGAAAGEFPFQLNGGLACGKVWARLRFRQFLLQLFDSGACVCGDSFLLFRHLALSRQKLVHRTQGHSFYIFSLCFRNSRRSKEKNQQGNREKLSAKKRAHIVFTFRLKSLLGKGV